MTLPPIYWTTYLDVVPSRVFHTLTTAEGWDGWFTRGTSIDARVGGQLALRWTDAELARHRVTLWGPVHVALELACPIVEFEPDRRFAFEWTTAGHPTTVDFQLSVRGPGTMLTVTETGYAQADLVATGVVGEMAQRSPFAMCASGWGEALTLLKFYLEHDVIYGAVPP